MNPIACRLALFLALGTGLPAAAAASPDETHAAYAIALGRGADAGELAGVGGFDATLAVLQAQLADGAEHRQAVATRAAAFVYGESSAATDPSAAADGFFAAQVAAHLADLAADQSAYRAVLQRVYQFVIGRDVYDEEIAYWSAHPTLPYALLVGCVEDWARRNQPGLMNTAGTPTVSVNCELLETLRLSPELGARVAAVLDLPASTTVLAPGGASLKSSGDIRFIVRGVR